MDLVATTVIVALRLVHCKSSRCATTFAPLSLEIGHGGSWGTALVSLAWEIVSPAVPGRSCGTTFSPSTLEDINTAVTAEFFLLFVFEQWLCASFSAGQMVPWFRILTSFSWCCTSFQLDTIFVCSLQFDHKRHIAFLVLLFLQGSLLLPSVVFPFVPEVLSWPERPLSCAQFISFFTVVKK